MIEDMRRDEEGSIVVVVVVVFVRVRNFSRTADPIRHVLFMRSAQFYHTRRRSRSPLFDCVQQARGRYTSTLKGRALYRSRLTMWWFAVCGRCRLAATPPSLSSRARSFSRHLFCEQRRRR